MYIAIIVLLGLAVLSNLRALDCFFLADDFLCMDYLYRGFHGQPELLLQRLFSPWQDRSTSLFYRPICDLFFFADYAFWRNNAFGYHLSNLLLHCGATLMLFFTLLRAGNKINEFDAFSFAFVSAAIFAVYPLHVESVVWPVGRADLFATICILATLYFSIPSILENRKSFGIVPVIFYLLALFSKEASACAPAIILAYWLLMSKYQGRLRNLIDKFMPFVLATLAYLLVRFLVLGTILGGYTGSLAEALKNRWWEHLLDFNAFSLLGLGVNLMLFGPDSAEVILLHVLYLALAAIMIIRIFLLPWDSREARLIAFLAVSSLLSYVPALQVIGVTGALSNSRVFYLPSAFFIPFIVAVIVPLSASPGLTTVGAVHDRPGSASLPGPRAGAKNAWSRMLKIASLLILSVLAVLFAFISKKNYEPWLEASEILKKFQIEAAAELRKSSPARKLVLINLTPNQKGAHVVYEAAEVKTMLGKAFWPDDYSKKMLSLNEFPDFGASTSRLSMMLQAPDLYDVRMFDLESLKFLPVSMPKEEALREVSGSRIIPAAKPNQFDKAVWVKFDETIYVDDGSQIYLRIDWHGKKYHRHACICLCEDEKAPPSDYLAVTAPPYEDAQVSDYHFSTFELRRYVENKPSRWLYVQLPEDAEILKAELIPGIYSAQIRPDLNCLTEMSNGNYSPSKTDLELDLDVSSVPNAASMVLEMAGPNYLFNMGKICLRDPSQYKHLTKKTTLSGTKNKFKLPVSELKPGYRYAFRLCALDSQGNYTGFYSDTVCIDLR